MNVERLPKRATVADLALVLERSEKQVRECIHARKLKRGKDKKYPVAPIVEEHLERQKRNTRRGHDGETLGDPVTWSDQLRAKQVEKLQVQIDELRGALIPVEEVRQTLSELCDLFKGGLASMVQLVGVELKDAKAVRAAEGIRAKVLRQMQAKLEGEA